MCSLLICVFPLTWLLILDSSDIASSHDLSLLFLDTIPASPEDLLPYFLDTATASSDKLVILHCGLFAPLPSHKHIMACIFCNNRITAEQQYYWLSEMDGDFIRNVFGDLNQYEITGDEILCNECFIEQQRLMEIFNVPQQLDCFRCRQSINADDQYYLLSEIGGELRNIILAGFNDLEPEQEHICGQCFTEAIHQLNNENQVVDVHHCAWCNRFIRDRRSYALPEGPLHDHIAERIHPRQIIPGQRLCSPCYQRGMRQIEEAAGARTYSTLPNYHRSPDSNTSCFVRNCRHNQLVGVPSELRKRLLKTNKFLITRRAVVCQEHIEIDDWAILNEMQYSNRFTSSHIEYMLAVATESQGLEVNDFENFESLDESTCKYWTGLSKPNFQSILNESPSLGERFARFVITALAIYLIKLRTGDSNARIALLFKRAESYISKTCSAVRTCLTRDFVPRHLGFDALPRHDLIQKNLMIPEGLFGNQNALDNRAAITICDGTYVYTQSSSNYKHQRRTFSPNKHTNLVKAFLLVATDGHIVEIVGPYAATVSDATIMKNLFRNPNSAYRHYYREGDVFLLDRGFRDAIPMLTNLNFNVHMPETKRPGETQLSTMSANRSRLVTLCRWVVEIVNGRFKRDYKIFRQDFFNLAATHLMEDFKIVGAIINAYHRVIANRSDAAILLDRALARLDVPNVLADYVIANNLNRRRFGFITIDGNRMSIPALDMFPVMTMEQLILFALGTYQIKQARSYYGEHIRENGLFQIDILRDVEPAFLPEIAARESLLIRGRLKSRFHNQKKHYCYILIDSSANDWEQNIKAYYCSCNIGRRTVGCCAHVMTVVWYLGWARHQDDVTAPATALDDILLE